MKNTILLFLLSLVFHGFAQETLTLNIGDSTQLKLSTLKIDTEIVGNYAITTYDMEFYNGYNRILEGELAFPLAEGQSVSRFAMEVNGALREAVIVEKELARVAFESTVRQTIDPGLLEKTQGNNYKARIYPIQPNKNKRVVISYEQQLSFSDNHYSYLLPLQFGEKLKRFSLNVLVNGHTGTPSSSDNYLNFTENKNVYSAEIAEKNHAPSDPILIKIPKEHKKINATYYQDYFSLTIPVGANTRLKAKPNTITLLWDTSLSMKYRDIDKELNVLDAYFNYLSDVTVEFITFSNAIDQKLNFEIKNSDWSVLRKIIEQQQYDGGTSLGILENENFAGDEILLFSDGLSNLASYNERSTHPIYTINSLLSADYQSLNSASQKTGGQFINLSRLSLKNALNLLKYQSYQFLGIDSNKDIYDVYPNTLTTTSNTLTVTGRFNKPTDLELHFGYQSEVVAIIRVDLDNASNSKLSKRLWAKEKLKSLQKNKKENKDVIIKLAKKHHLITDYTSLLILDRIEDYVRYRIEPPAELKEAYKNRIKELKDHALFDQEDIQDRKEEIAESYEELIQWYTTKFPKKEIKKKQKRNTSNPRPDQSQIATTNPQSNTSSSSATGTASEQVISTEIDITKNIIRGRVIDDSGIPLLGATVLVKGTNRGTQTDFDGNFILNADQGEVLQFSYIGFTSSEMEVSSNLQMTIELETDNSLDEVVVTAMSVRRERRAASSVVSVVSVEELESHPSEDVARLLQGRAPGIQITSTIGEPGATDDIIIRGTNNINTTNSPLYILNGLVVNENPTSKLSPEEITSMSFIDGKDASKLYGSRATNGIVIVTTKTGEVEKAEAIEKFNNEVLNSIEFKPWNPEASYLDILRKEASLEDAYAKYLEIRDEYSNSPSFYLDVSDFFENQNNKLALRVLSNLAEIELDNYELLRALGYKLEYFKKYEQAVYVYEKLLELRPEDPQSYRDLALIYGENGNYQKSFDLLFKVYDGELLEKDLDERFTGIEQIAFVELNRLVARFGKYLNLSKEKRKLFSKLDIDLRVVIDWNHNDTDIDLWLTDPNKEKASYKNTLTVIGGRMSEDMIEGFGPEEFLLKKAIKGKYSVEVDYFADSLQKISGPAILKVTIFTNYGRKNETKKVTLVRLDKEEDEIEVERIEF